MPSINQKDLEKFKAIIYNMPKDELKVIYDAMDTYIASVPLLGTESQDLNAYDSVGERNDKLFDILKKYGLCDFERKTISDPVQGRVGGSFINNFRWTGPLTETNSSPSNVTFDPMAAFGTGIDLKIPNECTDTIAVWYSVGVKWREDQEENDEELQKQINVGNVSYVDAQIRIPTTPGPFPTRFIPVDCKLPIQIDNDQWNSNVSDSQSIPQSSGIRIPYKIWAPLHDIDHAIKESKIRTGVTLEEVLEAFTVLQHKIILELGPEVLNETGKIKDGLSELNQKAVDKSLKILVKLGAYVAAREANAFSSFIKTDLSKLTDTQRATLLTNARLKAQKILYYGPESTQWLKIYGGAGMLTLSVFYDSYGFVDAISKGDVGTALTYGWSLSKTGITESLKVTIKHAVTDAAIARSMGGFAGPPTARMAATAATEGVIAGNVIVWSSLVPELIVYGGLIAAAAAADDDQYNILFNLALEKKLEPYIYAGSGGRYQVPGEFNTEKAIKSKSGSIITAPLEYPKSDGTSLPSEYFPYGLDPTGVITGNGSGFFFSVRDGV
jgi:hypothetical protein